MSNREPELVVEKWVDTLGGFLTKYRNFSIKLGNIESDFLEDKLDKTSINKPIYVSGLARSGSTILLEILAKQRDTGFHRYQDYPPIFTPYFWNLLLKFIAKDNSEPVERAHKDRILITPESPEAMEEILWMTFFPEAQDESKSSVLNLATSNPKFETFYKDHIKKILLARKTSRYLAKANYNTTRLQYLQKILPDAKFIVPIREPVAHIASLIKQHHFLCKGEEKNPRALEHMRRIGHFEFGLDRRAINTGDDQLTQSITQLWADGENVRGYARLWNAVYLFIAQQLEQDKKLASSTLIIRYEDLCDDPSGIITRMFDHTELSDTKGIVDAFSKTISKPSYYKSGFSDTDLEIIYEETAPAAKLFNY